MKVYLLYASTGDYEREDHFVGVFSSEELATAYWPTFRKTQVFVIKGEQRSYTDYGFFINEEEVDPST